MIIPTKKTYNPIVSVIVTTYNRQEYLIETILSILNQTFQDFELIIVDNFSNYDFFKLIKSFDDKRIKALQNDNNGIIAINRNVGIKEAQGKYLAFCDDDDLWESGKLQYQIQYLEKENFDLIYTNTKLMFDNGNLVYSNYMNLNNLGSLIYRNQITLSSVLVKNTIEVRFNESVDLIALEDYYLWINLMLNGFKFKFIERPLAYYRVHQSISTQSKYINEKRKLKFTISLFQNNKIPLRLKYIIFFKLCKLFLRLNIFYIIRK